MVKSIKYNGNNESDKIRAIFETMGYFYARFNEGKLPIIIIPIRTKKFFNYICDNYNLKYTSMLQIDVCDFISNEIIICDTKTETSKTLLELERKIKIEKLNGN